MCDGEREFDMTQCQMPHGEEGFRVIEGMNRNHRPYIEWGMANIPDIDPRTILDIGYGGGIFTRYALKRYPRAMGYGIDISETSYRYASQYDRYFIDEGRLKLIIGNADDMPYEDGKFDLVISNASYFFWPDLAETFKEVARVMAEGAVFCMPGEGDVTEENIEEYRAKWGPPMNIYLNKDILSMLDAAGFDSELIADPGDRERCVFISVKRRAWQAFPGDKDMDGNNSDLKRRIKEGWDLSASGFTDVVVPADLSEPRRSGWADLIVSKSPSGRLKVLDVGCGPGVFSIIMAQAGHEVVGIDVSDRMREEALRNSAEFGVSPSFYVMDSDCMSFADGTFDLVVSRDVMWIMPDPDRTMREWFRVLRSGGSLVYFDGAHPARGKDFDIRSEYSGQRSEYQRENGKSPPCSYKPEDFEKARGFKRDLPLTYAERPAWDVAAAARAGFAGIECVGITEDLEVLPEAGNAGGFNRFRLSAVRP
jgi:SAM-dependent methyltransferase